MITTLSREETALFRRLSGPVKIQDYLETLRFNNEPDGETLRSPRWVIAEQKAHCIEGALFAATALLQAGERPLLLDLRSAKNDFDHVVALYRAHGHWGAISKTNHAVLRFREPVYRTIRELALSYFHEYFLDDGTKTMRDYSRPFDLSRYKGWVTATEDLWYIAEALDESPHYPIASARVRRSFRKADLVEIKAGRITQDP